MVPGGRFMAENDISSLDSVLRDAFKMPGNFKVILFYFFRGWSSLARFNLKCNPVSFKTSL
jgi:hypothetical protein